MSPTKKLSLKDLKKLLEFSPELLDKTQFNYYSTLCHPDLAPEEAATFKRLKEWFEKGEALAIVDGIKVLRQYSVDAITTTFQCENNLILRVANEPRLNSYIGREINSLKKLSGSFKESLLVPQFLQQANIDGKSAHFSKIIGPLYPISECEPLDDRTIGWVANRLFSLLQYTEEKNTPNNNITKSTLFINPEAHSICLIDWTLSGPLVNFKIPDIHRDSRPPEVLNKKDCSIGTDIYSIGKLFNPENRFLKQFFGSLLHSKKEFRTDPVTCKENFSEILEKIFGEPRFHPMNSPSSKPLI